MASLLSLTSLLSFASLGDHQNARNICPRVALGPRANARAFLSCATKAAG
jgi:hypothetical protein